MKRLIASHYAQLIDPAAADVVVPERIHLIPAGIFTGRDGRGPYRIADMAALIAASQGDAPLIIDEGHATDIGEASAPAFGRITALEGDETGLWGAVTWNKRGTASLQEREYWGISPVFEHDANGTVLRLLRASLTNIPNLRLAALNARASDAQNLHSQEPDMNLLDQLRAVLGLDAKADEAAVVAHAKALATRDKEATATHAALCATLKIDVAAANPEAVVAAVKSIQAATQTPPQNTALQAAHDKLAAEVETLMATAAAKAMTAAVDDAIKSRKAAPSERAILMKQFAKMGEADFAEAMAARVELVGGQAEGIPAPSTHAEDGVAVGKRAAVYIAQQAAKGIAVDILDAVAHCQANPEAGK
jgi:phage I-like protein